MLFPLLFSGSPVTLGRAIRCSLFTAGGFLLGGCVERDAAAEAHANRADSAVAAAVPITALPHDSAADSSTALIAAGAGGRAGRRGKRAKGAKPIEAVHPAAVHRTWPPPPLPLAEALLPTHRIVAFYGNPLTTRLGILGRIPPTRMLDSLTRVAALWQAADSSVTVRPALHMIVTVAQGLPGKDAKHRLRTGDSTIAQVARWAEARGWLLFLDIQVGNSTVADELPHLLPFLRRPYVHLALDPEFAMHGHGKPGRRIGTMDATEINHAVRTLAQLVTDSGLPPKVLVVHRFTNKMLTNAGAIERDPRVQVVIDMDGFGPPSLKRATWRHVVLSEPVQYTGWKLFLDPRLDQPMMRPDQVIAMWPAPLYIQYQ